MPNTIEPKQVAEIQHRLGLKDTEIARALGITRQTWRNWRLGRTIPYFVGHGLKAISELYRLDPANENLPESIRQKSG